MAVVNVPVSGRARFTYLGNLPDLSISGINPLATPAQMAELAQGIQSIQAATVNDGFLISEFELQEEA